MANSDYTYSNSEREQEAKNLVKENAADEIRCNLTGSSDKNKTLVGQSKRNSISSYSQGTGNKTKTTKSIGSTHASATKVKATTTDRNQKYADMISQTSKDKAYRSLTANGKIKGSVVAMGTSARNKMFEDSELEDFNDTANKGVAVRRGAQRAKKLFGSKETSVRGTKVTEKSLKTAAKSKTAVEKQVSAQSHRMFRTAVDAKAATSGVTKKGTAALLGKAGSSKAGAAVAAGGGGAVVLGILAGILILILLASILGGGSSKPSFNTAGMSPNEAYVATYLHSKGVDNIHIAAIMGNIQAESDFDFGGVEQGNAIGHGLVQWSFGRWNQLSSYASFKNKPWTEKSIQMDFLWAELTGEGDAANFCSIQMDWNSFLAISDISEATRYFMNKFERPNADPSINHIDSRRIPKALEYLAIMNAGNGGGSSIPADGDGYSSEFTSSSGHTYREYKQWWGSYSGLSFSYFGDSIASSGCSITSVAIITSGYSNNQSPGTLADAYPNLAGLLEQGGCQTGGKEHFDLGKLTSGRPCLVNISGTIHTENGSKYYGGHYIAVLDSRNGDEVFISDPGANTNACGGWTSVWSLKEAAESSNDELYNGGAFTYVYN